MKNYSIDKKRVLVTGACGTVGSELIKQLVQSSAYSPTEIIAVDNNENALFFLDQEYLYDKRIKVSFCDIRDRDSLTNLMEGIDIVFHTAALKHVVMMERSPEQALLTNIMGVQNVIHAAQVQDAERVIFTSSDKAVNPTNVMGTSKLMGERLITAANSNRKKARTIFASTRFGNVLGSNGSVFPIFRRQIENNGPLTLTHYDMTRFVMSIEDSVAMVINSAHHARGGEIFITKMPVVKIRDLAEAMINIFKPGSMSQNENIEIKEIGTKPGEKLYEELMSSEETRRAMELKDFFCILPAFRGLYHDIDYEYDSLITSDVSEPYNSATQKSLSKIEIVSLLRSYNLIDENHQLKFDNDRRYWPGDKETS